MRRARSIKVYTTAEIVRRRLTEPPRRRRFPHPAGAAGRGLHRLPRHAAGAGERAAPGGELGHQRSSRLQRRAYRRNRRPVAGSGRLHGDALAARHAEGPALDLSRPPGRIAGAGRHDPARRRRGHRRCHLALRSARLHHAQRDIAQRRRHPAAQRLLRDHGGAGDRSRRRSPEIHRRCDAGDLSHPGRSRPRPRLPHRADRRRGSADPPGRSQCRAPRRGEREIDLGLALHTGSVMYGNIGAPGPARLHGDRPGGQSDRAHRRALPAAEAPVAGLGALCLALRLGARLARPPRDAGLGRAAGGLRPADSDAMAQNCAKAGHDDESNARFGDRLQPSGWA